ncbi:HinT-interacting membrane complex protein P80 [Mycoplasma sp. 1232]|uniref:HinT-interacting membrane complex protein P80 n=1 Tax=Mycoplasma sp. 1232 TaxID=3108527 RepID=UPI002B261227|nr:hypothetical protein [Mycoplasma sp. 1232]MEA4333772.1 hypothetical protein [Mycoplasma sp. 1232]
MAKRQKSFFERLVELNDRHDEKKHKTSTNKSKRSKTLIGIFSALTVGVIASITIPLTITTTKVNYIQPVDGEKSAFVVNDAKGNELNSLTVRKLTDLVKSQSQEVSEEIKNAYREAIFYMYEQEVEASIQYQNIYNSSLQNDEEVNNSIELKSLDEIKRQIKAKFEDLKVNFKKVYGFQNWEKQFFEELKKDEYGNSANETDATNFLLFKQVEEIATRRYQLEYKVVDRTFVNRTATKDIYKLDKNGNKVKGENSEPIKLFSKGDKVFPYLEENVNYFAPSADSTKVTLLTTKSFITEFKSPANFISEYFNKNNIIIPTVYKLAGTISKNDVVYPWKISSDDDKVKLFNLLKWNVTPTADSFIAESNVASLTKFNKAEEYAFQKENETKEEFVSRVQKYKNFLSSITNSDVEKLATPGLTSNINLFAKDLDLALGVNATSIFANEQNNLPEFSLKELIDAIKGALNILDQPDLTSATNFDEAARIVKDYDVQIDKKLEDLKFEPSRFNTINKVIADYMFSKVQDAQTTNNPLIPYVFKLSDMKDAFMIITDSNVQIVRYSQITELDKFKQFIAEDAKNLALGNVSYFNTPAQISNNLSSSQILSLALSDEKFVADLKTKTNTTTGANYTDADVTSLQAKVNSVKSGEDTNKLISVLTSVSEFIQKQLNYGNSYNFIVDKGLTKIVYNHNDNVYSDKKAIEVINDLVYSIFEKNEGSK